MEVKIIKEIREYKEKIFFGFTLKQCIFAAMGVGASAGAYFMLRDCLDAETLSWVSILCAFPFMALGFVRYKGMSAGQFLTAWIRLQMMPKRLEFIPENTLFRLCKPIIEQNKREVFNNNEN